jgi:hypothetical protein
MKNAFYIVDEADSDKFPLIGTENFDGNGIRLMSDEDFEMFAHNVMHLFKLRCPDRALALVFETVPDLTQGLPGLEETNDEP